MPGEDHLHIWPLHTGPDWKELSHCHECGLRMLRVLSESPDWVCRRVERIAFLDDRTIRRSVSVDYQSPAGAVTLRAGAKLPELRILPFAVMRRKSLINFDFRDEEGRPMPLLGLRESQALTLAIVRAWASRSLLRSGQSPTLTSAVDCFLEDVVAGDQQELEAAYRRMEKASEPDPGKRTREQFGQRTCEQFWQLAGDPVFRVVLDRLANNFLAYSIDRAAPGTRQVVKFSYDEPLMLRYSRPGYRGYPQAGPELPTYAPGPLLGQWHKVPLSARFGLRPTLIRFPVPGAEMAASYHVEIEAPPDVSIEQASLLAGRPNDDPAKKPLCGPSTGDENGADRIREGTSSRPSFDRVGGGYPTVDLHVSGVPLGSLSRAQVALQPTTANWLPIALSCWIVTLTLFVALASEFWGDADEEGASSLLIGFTAAVAGLLVRPDRHGMATHLLSGLRNFALVSAGLAFGSAIGFTFFPTYTEQILAFFLAVSLVPTILGGVAHFRARRRMKKAVAESPWEQRIALGADGKIADPVARRPGSSGSERMKSMLRKVDHAPHPYDAAASALGFDTPAIRVESSEGARQDFRWTTDFQKNFFSRFTDGDRHPLEEARRTLPGALAPH